MKKALCLLLSLALVFSCVLPLSAAAADSVEADYPVIRIAGLGGSFYNEGQLVFPPQADTVVSAISKALTATPALIGGVLTDLRQQQVLEVAGTFFRPIAFDKNGEPSNNTTKTFTYPDLADYDGEYIFFDYDWRLDPFEIADRLKAFIDYVKEETGKNGVYLIGESMGTAEMDTYLSVYGFDGVKGVVWCNGAYNGVASCGDSFANKNDFNKDALLAFLKQLSFNADNNSLFDLFTALDESGLLTTVFNSVLSATEDLENSGMFSRFIREYIGRIPGFWALVGRENYPAAREFVFPTDEIKQEYSVLLGKLDRYYNEVSSKTDDIMSRARELTGKVGVICGYGEVSPPVTSDNLRQSDSVILTCDESNGATCAPLGQSFEEGYVQIVNDGHNHISPDRVIDASTAFFPDNTWFIKYGHHSFNGAKEIADNIFFNEGFNVFSSESLPQFLVRDPASGEVSPLTAENSAGKTMVPGLLSRVLKAVFSAINTCIRVYKIIYGIFVK